MANVHKTALETLARVTFTMGLVGCIETGVDGEDEVDFGPDTGDENEVDGAVDVFADAVVDLPDGAEPDGMLVIIDEDGGLADGDFLADAMVDEPDAEEIDEADAAEIDAETGDATTTEDCSQFMDDWEAREACCSAIDWDFQNDPSCTPWGPPVPPTMKVTR